MRIMILVIAFFAVSGASFAQTNCGATAPTIQNNSATLCWGDMLPAPVLSDSGTVLPDMAYILVNNSKQIGGSPLIVDANSTGIFEPFSYGDIDNGDEVCVIAARFDIEQVRNLVEGILNGSYTAGTPCCNLIEALLDGVCEELDAQGVTGASSVVGLSDILNVVEVLYGEELTVTRFSETIDLLNSQGAFLPTACGGGSVNIPICFAIDANAKACYTTGFSVSGGGNIYIDQQTANGSVTLIANGTGPFTYTWSNTASGASQTGLSVGQYTITVVDGNNCTVIETVNVLDSCALLTFDLQLVPVSCNGGNDALAFIEPIGGTPDYVVTPTSGSAQNVASGSSASFFSLSAGSYSYTITDNGGCSTNVNFDLVNPDPVFIAVDALPDTLDLDVNDTLYFSLDTMYGGDLPINLSWNFDNSKTSSLSEGSVGYNSTGNYEITLLARDARNCTYTVTHNLVVVGITSVDELNIDANYTVYPNPSVGKFLVDMGEPFFGEYAIFDVAGEEVMQGSTINRKTIEIDLSAMTNGIYFLQLEGEPARIRLMVLR